MACCDFLWHIVATRERTLNEQITSLQNYIEKAEEAGLPQNKLWQEAKTQLKNAQNKAAEEVPAGDLYGILIYENEHGLAALKHINNAYFSLVTSILQENLVTNISVKDRANKLSKKATDAKTKAEARDSVVESKKRKYYFQSDVAIKKAAQILLKEMKKVHPSVQGSASQLPLLSIQR